MPNESGESIPSIPMEPVRSTGVRVAEHVETPPTPTQASNSFLKENMLRLVDVRLGTAVASSAIMSHFLNNNDFGWAVGAGLVAFANLAKFNISLFRKK